MRIPKFISLAKPIKSRVKKRKSIFKNIRLLQLSGIILGLGSTIWFLIRVIPKPSRATYPCIQAAAPIASGFIIYVLGLLASIAAFRKAQIYIQQSRYFLAVIFILITMGAAFLSISGGNDPASANFSVTQQEPNAPIGEARGIFPGRVVWVHDSTATNQA